MKVPLFAFFDGVSHDTFAHGCLDEVQDGFGHRLPPLRANLLESPFEFIGNLREGESAHSISLAPPYCLSMS